MTDSKDYDIFPDMTTATKTEECGACGQSFADISDVFSHECSGMAAKAEQIRAEFGGKFVTRQSNFGSGTTTLPAPGAFRTSSGKPTPRSTEPTEIKMMSAAQQKFIKDLLAKREGNIVAQNVRKELNAHHKNGSLTTRVASDAIARLRAVPEGACKIEPEPVAPVISSGVVQGEPSQDGPREAPKSKPNQYRGKCGNCNKWVEEREGVREFIDSGAVSSEGKRIGKWVVWHREGECPSSNMFPFPDGRYAVDNAEGLLRFYLCREGKVFVMASNTEHRIPDNAAKTIIEKIAIDPELASRTYGREIGDCGRCGRTLTNEVSRAAGIGPICASKGW